MPAKMATRNITDLDTPAVIVDLKIMQANLKRMAQYCRQYGLSLRPHTKTHKIPELARMQLSLGAHGITVAKLGEAEIMHAAGIDDILIAYPICGAIKLKRLAQLAQTAGITVAFDSLEVAQGLSSAARTGRCEIGAMVEADVGYHRCGIASGKDLIELCQRVASLPGLTFKGVMIYPGHIWGDAENRRSRSLEVGERVATIAAMLKQNGFENYQISGGSTPSAYFSHLMPEVTEIRPGTYIFNDMNTCSLGAARIEECAASVRVSVISTAVDGQIVIDGGSKTFSSDRLLSGDGHGFGFIREAPEARFLHMNEEHGLIDVRQCKRHFRIGESLTIIPNHVCATINMHEVVYGIEDDSVCDQFRVAARGKVC